MKVTAAEGLKVPQEGKPRQYITEVDQVDIEPTAYYLRRLADKELVEVGDVQPNPTGAAAAGKATAKNGSRSA